MDLHRYARPGTVSSYLGVVVIESKFETAPSFLSKWWRLQSNISKSVFTKDREQSPSQLVNHKDIPSIKRRKMTTNGLIAKPSEREVFMNQLEMLRRVLPNLTNKQSPMKIPANDDDTFELLVSAIEYINYLNSKLQNWNLSVRLEKLRLLSLASSNGAYLILKIAYILLHSRYLDFQLTLYKHYRNKKMQSIYCVM